MRFRARTGQVGGGQAGGASRIVTVVGDGALSPVDHDSAEPPVPLRPRAVADLHAVHPVGLGPRHAPLSGRPGQLVRRRARRSA